MTFDELVQNVTFAAVRDQILGIAQAAGLQIRNWRIQGVGYQTFASLARTAHAFVSTVPAIVRGFASLDTSTDPGDEDPYDAANVNRTPSAGPLSWFGLNVYGTPRGEETFANGFVTFANASGGAVTVLPEALTFTRSTVDPATGQAPTYRNVSADEYESPDGTTTITPASDGTFVVPNGVSLLLPIEAEVAGTGANASAGTISLTTVPAVGCTATNAAAVLGSDRESADDYRARCRAVGAAISPNGPGDAYRYRATGAKRSADGEIFYLLPNSTTGEGIDADGLYTTIPNASGVSLGITRVYVSTSSSTGLVVLYFATASGAPAGGVVSNLEDLFDVTYWPDCTTRSFNAAVAETINITATVKARRGAGVTVAIVEAAINAALEAAFPTFEIGGYDQTDGAGTLYANEVLAIINGAHPSIYSVTSALANTALALGRVPVLGTVNLTTTVA